MSLNLGSLELYMGPNDLGSPDNLEETIINFIDDAQEKLDIAVQELESRPIAEAVIRARQRDLNVRVILEGKYLTVDEAVDDPWSAMGENEANREIYSALLRAKVCVISDLNPETYHQKFILRDPEGTRSAVLTGSTNFTPTGTHNNLNHIVVMKSKRIAKLYEDEFEEAWTGTFGVKNERHEGAPKTYEVSKVKIKTLFAPDHTPELEIMKQMLKGQHRVDFAMFTFSQSSGIDDTMIALSRGQMVIRGVLDRRQANQDWAATRPVANAGAELWWPTIGSGVGKVHHKLMVIDGQVVVAGSFNYTSPANAVNDENIIVVGSFDETDATAINRQQQFAGYAQQEIERIINDCCERIL